MKKIFIANDGFPREFSRKLAKGHKRLIINDDVESGKPITMKTEGTNLVMETVEDTEENEVYTILCKEFGLIGLTQGFKSKISVILLDDGWMLVTLLNGAIVTMIEDKPMMPIVGDDSEVPKRVVLDDAFWVNQEYLLSFSKNLDVKGQFMYDFEFVFTIGGDRINKMSNFYIKPEHDEDIDLSLGYFALYQQNQQSKADYRETKKVMRMVSNAVQNVGSYDFDDDDEDEDDEDEDDWDDEDDDDF